MTERTPLFFPTQIPTKEPTQCCSSRLLLLRFHLDQQKRRYSPDLQVLKPFSSSDVINKLAFMLVFFVLVISWPFQPTCKQGKSCLLFHNSKIKKKMTKNPNTVFAERQKNGVGTPSEPNKLFPTVKVAFYPATRMWERLLSSAGVEVSIGSTWFSFAWVKVPPHPVWNTSTTTGTGTTGLDDSRPRRTCGELCPAEVGFSSEEMSCLRCLLLQRASVVTRTGSVSNQ